MPETPLILGCTKPLGKQRSETDILEIRVGVNGIVYPSEEGYDSAERLGLGAV